MSCCLPCQLQLLRLLRLHLHLLLRLLRLLLLLPGRVRGQSCGLQW
jgi:hypothetical protein